MAKRTPVTGLGEARAAVLEHDSEELTLARTDGEVVTQFTANLRAFFGRAQELEATATLMLSTAKATSPPQTADEDAQIQRDIQKANAHAKTISEHWLVCQVLSRFHKRLTSARARGTDASENAARHLNALHQRYVDDANRRAREEADRLRREAEDRARQDRERELAVLKEAEEKAEASSPDLSDREERFVDAFFSGIGTRGNAWQSAVRAGFAQPRSAAERLMASPKIQAALKAHEDAQRAREQAAAVREQPVRVEAVTTLVQPEVQKIGTDRTTWSAEVLDERLFVEAVISGKFGVPLDCLTVNTPKVNELARSLHELLDRIPGVRAKKTVRLS